MKQPGVYASSSFFSVITVRNSPVALMFMPRLPHEGHVQRRVVIVATATGRRCHSSSSRRFAVFLRTTGRGSTVVLVTCVRPSDTTRSPCTGRSSLRAGTKEPETVASAAATAQTFLAESDKVIVERQLLPSYNITGEG